VAACVCSRAPRPAAALRAPYAAAWSAGDRGQGELYSHTGPPEIGGGLVTSARVCPRSRRFGQLPSLASSEMAASERVCFHYRFLTLEIHGIDLTHRAAADRGDRKLATASLALLCNPHRRRNHAKKKEVSAGPAVTSSGFCTHDQPRVAEARSLKKQHLQDVWRFVSRYRPHFTLTVVVSVADFAVAVHPRHRDLHFCPLRA